MKVENNFIYKLTDRLGVLVVVPLGESDFKIEYAYENDEKKDYEKQFSGKIIFTGAAFNRLMSMESSVYRCDDQILSVYKLCDGVEKLIFTGNVSLNESEFDLDKCMIIMKFLDDTKDKCIEDNKSEKINLFNFVYPRREVTLTTKGGTIETKECFFNDIVNEGDNIRYEYWCEPGEPEDGKWQMVTNIVNMSDGVSGNPGEGNSGMLTVRTTWAREVIEINCGETPEPDWLLIEDNCGTTGKQKYAQKVSIYNCDYEYQDFTNSWKFRYKYVCSYVGGEADNSIIVEKLRNGLLFNDSVKEMVKNVCPGLVVKSDFFQINPDNVSVINYVTGKRSTVDNIVIFQKSDVKRPSAFNAATKLEFSLDKLFEALKTMFNVKWRIEGNVFRLEHVSYFSRENGFDITSEALKKYFVGKRKYTYDTSEIPEIENFLFKEQGSNRDYTLNVEYTGCVSKKKKKEINNIVEEVMTDVRLCLNNPDSDSKVVTDNGVVFVSTRRSGDDFFINSEFSPNGRALNNVFAWVQLFAAYHYYERPMLSGIVNGTFTNFLTSIPTKKGEKFTIPLNICAVNFNPDNYIKTALGKGIVSSATYRLKDSFLDLELLYEANQDLTPNLPPVLVGGGSFKTYKNTPLTLNVEVSDGDGTVVSLIATQPPYRGTLNFISTTEFQVIPDVDYVGSIFFSIQALDNLGEGSNIVNYSINVVPPNQPPIARDDSYIVYQGYPFQQGSSLFANDWDDYGFELVNPNLTTVQGVNIVIDSAGYFNYIPPVGFEGNDSFQYQIKDDMGEISTATVTLTVRFKNKPIAVNDKYQTLKNTVFVTDGSLGHEKLTKNDYTPDGLNYTYTTAPENKATMQGGNVVIDNAGNFTYTPPNDFTGNDLFNYTVSNVNGSAIGSVEISVLPTVYVEMLLQNKDSEAILITCGDPPTNEIGGQIDRYDIVLKFYADSAKTTPLDVTGYGLKVNIKESALVNSRVIEDEFQTSILSGNTAVILDQYEMYEERRNCAFQLTFKKEVVLSILPGPYQILT